MAKARTSQIDLEDSHARSNSPLIKYFSMSVHSLTAPYTLLYCPSTIRVTDPLTPGIDISAQDKKPENKITTVSLRPVR